MIHLRLLKNSNLFALHRNKSVFSCKSSLRRVFGHIPHPTPESDKFEFNKFKSVFGADMRRPKNSLKTERG